jgi:O-6-methylguanine DNA methyltransferase
MKYFILNKDNYEIINDDLTSSLIELRRLIDNNIVTSSLCAFEADKLVALYLSDEEDPSGLVTELEDKYGDIVEIDPPANINELVPENPSGTDFQYLVWEGISRIPYGETWSYKKLAEEIGKPAAIRAVASACGKNEVSILIPCHRVVPSGKSGNGKYRWGSKIKEAILQYENRNVD